MNNFYKRLLITLVLSPLVIFSVYLGGWFLKILISLLALFSFYEIFLIKKLKIKLIIFIIFILFLFSIYFLSISKNGINYLLICIFVTWLSDIGGYFFGKIFGGKKINIISPNKTYSGFVGALIFPQFLSYYLNSKKIFILNDINHNFKYILILSLASIIGDLFFSYLKRILNIKDYSNLIPGHGGIFDRIDSLIFVTITFFILYHL